jgi:5-methylcytosine-specific restriction protein B
MNSVFLVGANFGKDVSKDFIKKGKWELGWKGNENHKQYKSILKIFNQIKVGDDLVIKSTYTRKKNLPFDNHGRFVSVMKIKAVGKVTKLVGDGHTVLVDWDKSFKEREWFFYTHRSTMWKFPNIENDEKAQKLYNFIFNNDKKQDYNYFMNCDDNINQEADEVSEYDIYMESLNSSHNIILHGAPGTGKTYLAKQVAAQMIGCSTDELYNSEQFDFVQFHPNYDYSDFVEGLRPVNHDGIVGFERRNGIFMNFCERAKSGVQVGGQDNFDEAWDKFIDSVLDSDDYYIVKTLNGKEMHLQAFERNGITGVTEKDSTSRYYNHDQCYNVYRGLSGVPKDGFDNYRKAIIKHLKEEFSLKDYKEPQEGSNKKPYVFVIDEINRGDISKILGELFFSIDPNYRGIKGAVTTQFSNLYDGTDGKNPGVKFYIPENVYVIGTMNDIDRSVDSFDFAMRRRFRFIEVKAEQRLSMLEELDEEKREEAEFRLLNLNRSISATEGLSESYHVGPSYFLKLKDLDYNYDVLWSDYIKPLLVEYLRGSYDFQEILDNLKEAYNTIDETGDLNESDGQ